MKITAENINKIKSALKYLAEKFELEEEVDKIEIGDEYLIIPFPRDSVEHSISDFWKYITEFESLEIIDNSTAKTNLFTNKVIYTDITPIDFLIEEHDFSFENEEGIKINLIENPILIGLAATKLDLWDKYAPPCSSYCALEIEYPAGKRYSPEEENNLIHSYLFEISNSANIVINFTEIRDGGYYRLVDEEEKEIEKIFKNKQIEKFNPCMDYFLKGVDSRDSEIRFLYFYKIFEYFSPIVARIKAFDRLRKKLDSPSLINPNGDFLQSIFQLSKEYDKSLYDKELIKYSIRECFDIIDLIEYLPVSINKRLRKPLRIEKINYEIGDDKIVLLSNALGAIIYSTRNQIVHAKSNYESDNNECPQEDLEQLNIFIKHACYSSIKWYNRLPEHLK